LRMTGSDVMTLSNKTAPCFHMGVNLAQFVLVREMMETPDTEGIDKAGTILTGPSVPEKSAISLSAESFSNKDEVWVMFKSIFRVLFCALLAVTLNSCAKKDEHSIQDGAGNRRMSYKVKPVLGTIELNGQWNEGQWKDVDVLELTNYMGDKPEHFPKTQARLLYDKDNLYVFFRVEDRYVRAVAEKTNGKVWQDSCVEFFFTPDAELKDIYFNLETNCGGTILFCYNDKQNNVEKYAEAADCQKVEVYHSLPKIIADEITEPVVWTLSYKLPFDVIAKYGKITKPQSGVIWRANFYKCADKTSHPHWLTWSFVDNSTPNFHLPQYFGTLEFE